MMSWLEIVEEAIEESEASLSQILEPPQLAFESEDA
jgi:hypothetical protein